MSLAALSHPEQAVAIEVRGVSRTFTTAGADVPALRDVSLTVAEGEFVSLIGPSGCGKSTLLRMLAGLDQPDRGTVSVEGDKVAAPSLSRGILFQDHRLLPWLTVEQNVDLGLHKSGLTTQQRQQRVSDLIALVGLAGFERAFPYQLSGGMSQRAAIARSLAPQPRVLLLDEPLGALDSLTRSKLQTELLRIWKHERITMLMVTHDVEEAVFLSDRVVVMEPRPGRIADIVDIPLPKPRHRGDPAFVDIKLRLLTSLEVETDPPANIVEH
ncbi:ABC transporter ATP-binding protein [Tianweitania populi]|uniref:Sulfonate ABC transporter ATP-binding protein n=1 Tax=Tianweitania populi TaxID=1607949 RepID=A0A8J3GJ47_9HYPH|nr:ABC transporter ATP-binding protein [Tianweitania populi]GHD05124.1 sulfonate ABC transporter ATP-binding protein [Tianweitania populi]